MRKEIVFLFFGLILISFISAVAISEDLHLNIQTTNASGSVVTGTFDFGFNISTAADCAAANVIYSNATNLTTDSRGIISYYLPDVSLDYDIQYWLCYYRNDTLVNSSKIARTPYVFRAKNITLSGVEVESNFNLTDYNVTDVDYGFFNYVGSLLNRITKLWVTDINAEGNVNVTGNLTVDTDTFFVDAATDRVGIGTTSPTETLMVNGSLRIQNTSGTLALYVDESTGNVGIGTSSPVQIHAGASLFGGSTPKMEILTGTAPNDNYEELVIIRHTGIHSTLLTRRVGLLMKLNDESTSGESNKMGGIIIDSEIAWAGLPKLHLLTTNEKRLTIDFLGNVGIGTTTPTETLMINGSLRVQNSSGTLALYVNESTGYVGIGTSDPQEIFEVYDSATTGDSLIISEGKGYASVGSIQLYSNDSDGVFLFGEDSRVSGNSFLRYVGVSGNYLQSFTATAGNPSFDAFTFVGDEFFFYKSLGVGNDLMAILNNGNVGIGTITPNFKLEVNGGLNVSNDLFVNHSTGYVGIGTATPQQKLNVVGNANITGNLSVNGNLNVSGGRVYDKTGYAGIPGEMRMYGGATAPTGWILANGSSLLRAGTYADLFDVIGVTFGSADGNHFNVPDMRGIFPRGAGAQTIGAQTFTGVLGTTTGDSTAKPNSDFTSGDQSASHYHLEFHNLESSSNLISTNYPYMDFSIGTFRDYRIKGGVSEPNVGKSKVQSVSHTHTVTAGGDTETAPANVGVTYIIKY